MSTFSPLSLSVASVVLGWSLLAGAQTAPAATALPPLPTPAELAQRQSDREAERQDIANQRRIIHEQLAVKEQACWQKFAVEDCLRRERAQVRKKEEVLRARDLLVNRQEREERANLRLRTIEHKLAEPRQPSRVDSAERPPLNAAEHAAELQRAQTQRDLEAQQRAQAAQQRQRERAAEIAAQQEGDAARRAKAAQDYEAKQREAAERRQAKQADIDSRTGQPLAVPPAAVLPKTP